MPRRDPIETISESLARWIGKWRQRSFAEDVLESAQTLVLDWMANTIAGRGTNPGRAILDYTRAQPPGGAAVVGERQHRSAEVAAFANGALSHIVEMDDVDRASVIHPSAVVIPAALAVAQRDEKKDRELLSAIIVGYEIAIRFGAAVGDKHYYHFHNTATCGSFGAAAAAGYLLGLDEEALTWALGNSGTMAFGLWEFNTDGSMSKHLHTGQAAANGLRASELATRGFTGARTIVEGKRGFFAGLAPEGHPEDVASKIDEDRFRLPGVSLKPYASCRHTHAAIDAAIVLRTEVGIRSIRAGTISVYQAAADLCDNPQPQTAYEAKFSLQHCVARALAGGSMGLGDFEPGPDITPSLTVVVDPQLEAKFPQQFPARLTLELDDGSTLVRTVDFPLGDPENPLPRERVEEKFFELATYGGMEKAEAQDYLDWINGLL